MRINWKLLTGFSLFGGAISLISGIAGGNPFGIILLRLLLSAVVFGALGLGVQAILRRYFPDLLQTAPRAGQRSGESVDIIIDEDLPASGERESREEPESQPERAAGEGGPEMEEILAEPLGARRPGGSAEELDDAELAVEVGEFGEEPETSREYQAVEFPEFDAELRAPVSTGAEAGTVPTPGRAIQGAEDEEVGDLEVLPEMENLEVGGSDLGSESDGPDSQKAGRPARRVPATPREMRQAQIEETVKDQDPETLARAVRTFLKKDQ